MCEIRCDEAEKESVKKAEEARLKQKRAEEESKLFEELQRLWDKMCAVDKKLQAAYGEAAWVKTERGFLLPICELLRL